MTPLPACPSALRTVPAARPPLHREPAETWHSRMRPAAPGGGGECKEPVGPGQRAPLGRVWAGWRDGRGKPPWGLDASRWERRASWDTCVAGGVTLGSAHTVNASRRVEPLRMPVATLPAMPRRSSGCGGSPRARASQPSLARQLNEVYRQITGAHNLQQTKFRWVLGAQGGVGGVVLPPSLTPGNVSQADNPSPPWGPSGSQSSLCPLQAAAQRREKVSRRHIGGAVPAPNPTSPIPTSISIISAPWERRAVRVCPGVGLSLNTYPYEALTKSWPQYENKKLTGK